MGMEVFAGSEGQIVELTAVPERSNGGSKRLGGNRVVFNEMPFKIGILNAVSASFCEK